MRFVEKVSQAYSNITPLTQKSRILKLYTFTYWQVQFNFKMAHLVKYHSLIFLNFSHTHMYPLPTRYFHLSNMKKGQLHSSLNKKCFRHWAVSSRCWINVRYVLKSSIGMRYPKENCSISTLFPFWLCIW